MDENGKKNLIWMGSYGVGVSRTITAIIEQNHDEFGIIWPMSVTPFHAIVTIVNTGDEEQVALGEKIYAELKKFCDVMLDDRKDRAGVKFADRDLIGIPLRITVGKRASENIVEFSYRKTPKDRQEISAEEAIEIIRKEVK